MSIKYTCQAESEDDSLSNTDYLYDISYKLDNDIFKQDGKYVAKCNVGEGLIKQEGETERFLFCNKNLIEKNRYN